MGKYEAVLFDLDDTIVNTSRLKQLRSRRMWKQCYSNLHQTLSIIEPETIYKLKENGVKIGIVTNSPRPYASRVINYYTYFYDRLICYHDTSKRKPHPDPLLKCAHNLGVEKQNIISIGDDENDIIASKSANMLSIGVTWGESTRVCLQDTGADYVVDSVKELKDIIFKLIDEDD